MYHAGMTSGFTRRELVHAGAAASLAVAQGPTILVPGAVKPLVIASDNGTCVDNNTMRRFAATKAIAYSSAPVRCARNSV